MPAQPIRIYILAKELDLPSEEVVAIAKRLDFDVSNALSAISPQQYSAIVDGWRGRPPTEPPLAIGSKLLPRGPRPGAAQQQLPLPEEDPGSPD